MSTEQFHSRLKLAIGGHSVNSFAHRCELPESLLRKYLSGMTLPGLDKLIAIAKTAGVCIEWLATGEGPMKVADSPASEIIDEGLLKDAIQAVEEYLAEVEGTLTPEKKAKLVVLLCQLHRKEAPESGRINKATVMSLVRLAA